MTIGISSVRGVSAGTAKSLKGIGITNSEKLLAKAGGPKDLSLIHI